MSIPTITKEQILQAIKEAQDAREQRPPHTYTARELGDILGMSPDSARRRGDQMVELGIAEKTEVIAVNARQSRTKTAAYRLLFPLNSPD